MCIQELSTCKEYSLPVKIILLNNGTLGMVRQWQQIEYEGRYSQSYMNALPDFVKLAEAYGHVGILVENRKTWSRPCGMPSASTATAPCFSTSGSIPRKTSGRWSRVARG